MQFLKTKFIFNSIESKNIASYFTNEIIHHSYINEDGSTTPESKIERKKRRDDEKQKALDLRMSDFISCLTLDSKDFKNNFLSCELLDKNEDKGDIDYKINFRNKEIYCEVTDTHLLSNKEREKFRSLLSRKPLIGALEFANKQNYSFLIKNVTDCIKNKKAKIIKKNIHINNEKWLLINILPSPLNYQYISNEGFQIMENNLKKYNFNQETLSLIYQENNNFFRKIVINLKYGTIKNNTNFIQEIYLILDFIKNE